MGEFLTTTGISHRLEEIIKNADQRLFLISPFFKMNDRLKEFLAEKDRLKTDVRVVYGKTELQPQERGWLDSLSSVRTSFCKDLHAKCYMNEDEALLTSMNLYEYSQVNNHEMGMLISRTKEPEIYRAIFEETMRIVRMSEETVVVSADRKTGNPNNGSRKNKQKTPTTTVMGFCIRCREGIPSKLAEPFCKSCFTSWNRYKNPKFAENYCHSCGNKHTTSFSRPECRSCYRKHQRV